MWRLCVLLAIVTLDPTSALPGNRTSRVDGDRMKEFIITLADFLKGQIGLNFNRTVNKLEDQYRLKFDSSMSHYDGAIKANLQTENPYIDCSSKEWEVVQHNWDQSQAISGEKFQLHIIQPNCKLIGNYRIEGEVLGHNVSGRGLYKFRDKNLATVWFDDIVLLETPEKTLTFDRLELWKDGEADIGFETVGLNVEDITVQHFEELLGEKVTHWINGNTAAFYNQVLPIFEVVSVDEMNRLVKNRKLEEVIRWMNDKISEPILYRELSSVGVLKDSGRPLKDSPSQAQSLDGNSSVVQLQTPDMFNISLYLLFHAVIKYASH